MPEAAPVKAASLTEEQRISGADSSADCVLLVTGYDSLALEHAGAEMAKAVARPGTMAVSVSGLYELSGTLTSGEA